MKRLIAFLPSGAVLCVLLCLWFSVPDWVLIALTAATAVCIFIAVYMTAKEIARSAKPEN